MNKFGEYLNKHFLKWQFETGVRKTQEEFAFYLEISRPLLTMWINGDRRPGKSKLPRLAELLDEEIYDAIDEPRPDPFVTYIQKTSGNLKQNQKKKIEEQIAKYLTANEKESTT